MQMLRATAPGAGREIELIQAKRCGHVEWLFARERYTLSDRGGPEEPDLIENLFGIAVALICTLSLILSASEAIVHNEPDQWEAYLMVISGLVFLWYLVRDIPVMMYSPSLIRSDLLPSAKFERVISPTERRSVILRHGSSFYWLTPTAGKKWKWALLKKAHSDLEFLAEWFAQCKGKTDSPVFLELALLDDNGHYGYRFPAIALSAQFAKEFILPPSVLNGWDLVGDYSGNTTVHKMAYLDRRKSIIKTMLIT